MFNNAEDKKTGTNQKSRPETGAGRKEDQPKRVPIHGMDRNILTVIDKRNNKDDFVKRWIMDKSDGGQRILRFKMAGYEFTSANNVSVGELSVYKSSAGGGSIVRVPADKEGNFLYLMEILKDYYDQDFVDKMKMVDDTEVRSHTATDSEGQYVKEHKRDQSLS